MTDKTDTKKQIAAAKPAPPLKRRGNVVYAANPFMEGEQRPNIKPRLKRITNRKGDMLVMGETGEIVNPVAGFWQSQEVDSAKFVKLFVNGVKAFRELTNGGEFLKPSTWRCRRTSAGTACICLLRLWPKAFRFQNPRLREVSASSLTKNS